MEDRKKGFLALLLALLVGACTNQPYPPVTYQAQPQWQQVMAQQHGLIYVCQPQQGSQLGGGQIIGTLGGAALGGYVGSEAIGSKAGTAGLAVLGAIIGNQVGQRLDQPQQQCGYVQVQQPYQQAPYYQPNHRGFGPGGMICKEFHSDHVTVVATGEIVEANFIGCKDNEDGFWRIMQ
jgi:outer membrane lipoprotein SlyB